MRNWVLPLLVALFVFAGCASDEWHWTDPGVHVVAGAWLKDERVCEIDASDGCAIALRAALDWLRVQDPTVLVLSVRWAQIPRQWADSAGRQHHLTNGSLFASSVAIVTLGDGQVRLVALLCGPDLRGDARPNEKPPVCSPQGDVWGQYLVGASRPEDATL